MTISRKHKRPIVVDQTEYFWWVKEDDTPLQVPSSYKSLWVATSSGEMLVEYPIGQPDELCHIVVRGRVFRAVSGCGGSHRRFRSPQFSRGAAVTPAIVAELVRWAISDGADPMEVNYLGLPLVGGHIDLDKVQSRARRILAELKADLYGNTDCVVEELLDVNETRLAVEILCQNVHDISLVLDPRTCEDLIEVAQLLGLAQVYWMGFSKRERP